MKAILVIICMPLSSCGYSYNLMVTFSPPGVNVSASAPRRIAAEEPKPQLIVPQK